MSGYHGLADQLIHLTDMRQALEREVLRVFSAQGDPDADAAVALVAEARERFHAAEVRLAARLREWEEAQAVARTDAANRRQEFRG